MNTRQLEIRAMVFGLVGGERRRQIEKWGNQSHKRVIWLSVLSEEVGELSQCYLHSIFGGPHGTKERELEELVQVAAVLVAWLEDELKKASRFVNTVDFVRGAVQDDIWEATPSAYTTILPLHLGCLALTTGRLEQPENYQLPTQGPDILSQVLDGCILAIKCLETELSVHLDGKPVTNPFSKGNTGESAQTQTQS